ncbi:MAG: serine hydrolase domain-containing protein [Candidatus Zhuqueibacterota bacterium]
MRIQNLLLCFSCLLLLVYSVGVQAQSLPVAKPESVGMSSTQLSLVKAMINSAIEQKDFPGAAIIVSRKGHIVLREAFGKSQWVPEERPMEIDMIFDMASVTKPVATATSIMILVEQGRIRLWDTVKEYIPEFASYVDENGKPGEDARIWHLLTHTSGLPPYTPAKEVEEKYGNPCPMDSLVKHIALLKKTDPPGTAFHYSCLGFITLAEILDRITGQTLAEFSVKHIYRPLKMENTFYNPADSFREKCVPTEVIDGKPLIGIVHDPLARLLSGVSGNAGLFSTADDLAIFAQMLLNKGTFEGIRILSPLTVERMTSVYPDVAFSGRGLGWDLNSAYSTNGGDLFGPASYGHSGYTGTSIWIDPETETSVIFLTNRVHPSDGGAVLSLRSRIANIVASSIFEK